VYFGIKIINFVDLIYTVWNYTQDILAIVIDNIISIQYPLAGIIRISLKFILFTFVIFSSRDI
jgi:hypothetical protein